jgi:hypothetical protein
MPSTHSILGEGYEGASHVRQDDKHGVCMCSVVSVDTVLNKFQVIATSIYVLLAAAGYLMFGNSVSGEVGINRAPSCLTYRRSNRSAWTF